MHLSSHKHNLVLRYQLSYQLRRLLSISFPPSLLIFLPEDLLKLENKRKNEDLKALFEAYIFKQTNISHKVVHSLMLVYDVIQVFAFWQHD